MSKVNEKPSFEKRVEEQEHRKLRSRKRHHQSEWMGLGMFGMIGWSVAAPTLVGVGAGVWLDKHYGQSFSWTLTLLLAGLFIGCIIAWSWVEREREQMHQDNDEND